MYRQHFGLTSQPLGKDAPQLWDDGPITALKERFQWLLENLGVALLTGEPGVGKTSALRMIADGLNPHRYNRLQYRIKLSLKRFFSTWVVSEKGISTIALCGQCDGVLGYCDALDEGESWLTAV